MGSFPKPAAAHAGGRSALVDRSMPDTMLLDRAVARARRRILPFLVLMYVLAFIDRSNVGFAKAAPQRDAGIGDAAFALGAGIFFCGYADARWMPADERAALAGAIAAEEVAKQSHGPRSFAAALRDRRVLAFCLVYFSVQMSVYGVTFYLPSRIAALMHGDVDTTTGRLSAIPWAVAIAATLGVTRLADRTGRRRELAVAMLVMAAAGIAASAFAPSLPLALLAFCFAAARFVAVQPLFWTLPTGYLGAAAAAGTIGLINAIGNLGGFVAPNLKSWVERATALPQAGMIALAAAGLVGALLLLLVPSDAPSELSERPT